MPSLVLLRHGQSRANLEGRFAGWEDSGLTEQGSSGAALAAGLLVDSGIGFVATYASMLSRAGQTLRIVLDGLDRPSVEQHLSWRLNERHYGAFQGRLKSQAVDDLGQPYPWRTEFHVAPPSLSPDDPRHPRNDSRFGWVDPELLPGGESLAMALERLRPLWEGELAPRLGAGENLLLVAHGTLLWLLARHLLNSEAFELPRPPLPNARPLVMDLGTDLAVREVSFLEPKEAGA